MDTKPQSRKHPFKSHKAQVLAPVTSKAKATKQKRRNRRRKKKGRKFGKELQNRGDLVYIRKDEKIKDCSTAETDKSQDVSSIQKPQKVNVGEVFNIQKKFKNADQDKIKKVNKYKLCKKSEKEEIKKTKCEEAKCETVQKVVEEKKTSIIELDTKNPQNVEAYKKRITEYILKRDKSRRIDPEFISNHKTLNENMRSKLVDWLVDVSFRFKLLDETLFAGIWIMDRYFAKEIETKKSMLQLIGVACLMISSKMEEVYPPSLEDYLKVCDGAYSDVEILDMEAHILSILQFDISVTSSLILFRFFTKNLSISKKSCFFGEYLLHSALLDMKSFKYSQNQLSAGAIFLVNKMFKEGIKWEPELYELTKISESKVKVVAKELYKILKRVSVKDWGAVKRKFSRVEVLEVAKFKVERVSKSSKK
jgi:hypothetical protein